MYHCFSCIIVCECFFTDLRNLITRNKGKAFKNLPNKPTLEAFQTQFLEKDVHKFIFLACTTDIIFLVSPPQIAVASLL